MARGIRKTVIDKLNERREERISTKARLTAELVECSKEISQLEQDIENEEVRELSLMLRKSGKSVEDIKKLLTD